MGTTSSFRSHVLSTRSRWLTSMGSMVFRCNNHYQTKHGLISFRGITILFSMRLSKTCSRIYHCLPRSCSGGPLWRLYHSLAASSLMLESVYHTDHYGWSPHPQIPVVKIQNHCTGVGLTLSILPRYPPSFCSVVHDVPYPFHSNTCVCAWPFVRFPNP
ncbi:hypothetical protein Pmar_PMAR009304 [Perkinsus marinus ATCC 50983]|uniref:Uncharacterized protein n=1 Tax=Perkinsus marinus (strain ATCC 50983 / TXsc) TaxID=423536 RepID=C5LP38_PERM5|nr:hypothetical protein Pmar_PMAR009304 [Perkinsus marinus ATCC 50983]XP_002768787.1 hypothetical protein Pmar_PMAR009304 [Perkinsus marinus ATCC 50983]EER01504.1 hypothetical protein Pmar_PMAR009304 [Perkinsus marinus ATCC 50983]EER01505.1 hypothetical protein Pmar_PMAR009304 [Perkinsus marinus ATCC 50983]|eukprot:XP_002768786.1 hypothetical protein Pmar_PMAR009304 [Perkinsus marinus ATCC 50983]